MAQGYEAAAPYLAVDEAFGFEKLVGGCDGSPVQAKRASQFTSGWQTIALG
jgi:hypothetical protein